MLSNSLAMVTSGIVGRIIPLQARDTKRSTIMATRPLVVPELFSKEGRAVGMTGSTT